MEILKIDITLVCPRCLDEEEVETRLFVNCMVTNKFLERLVIGLGSMSR